FQGRLSESGQPAEGSKTFLFRIYDVSSGGTAVWEGASQLITLSQGVFSAELSAGTPALSTATFAGARYVEIIVDGVTLSPRQEMVSAPYALVAQALAADAVLPAATIGAGAVTDYHVTLTTAAIGAGRFADDRVLITTGAFAALNGADQLVKLDASGNLPVLNGSALTNVAAASYSGSVAASQLTGVINDNRLAISSGAFPGGFNEASELLQLDGSALVPAANVPGLPAAKIISGKFYDAQVALSTGAFPGGLNGASQLLALDGSALVPVVNIPDLSTGKITGGKFYDERMAISSGAFTNGFNEANELLQLDASALVPVANVPDLAAAKITSGKFYDAQLAISTGAFPGGFNGADQLVKLDASGRLGVGGVANSKLAVAGSVALPIKTVTFPESPYTVTENDSTILVNASGGDVTVNLPSAAGIAGRIYAFKRVDDPISGRLVSINASGIQTIDGSSSWPLNSFQWEVVVMQSTGSGWILLSS
ncbi:MAG: hypothetical protein ACYC2I_11385, partial [Elusimicrobiales bacterium]